MKTAITLAALLFSASAFSATPTPDPATCPLHEQHMKDAAKHAADVDARHDTLVASHETTRHSFRLFADGGAIELRATNPADAATIDAVRGHLHEITAQFVAKDFSTPAFVHGKQPPGIAEMTELHDSITFRYETLDGGGRIRMKTSDPRALAAIHDFLKFQVVEHRTDISSKVEEDK